MGIQNDASTEPLLQQTPRRFVLFPLKFKAIWSSYKSAAGKFWVPDSIQIGGDKVRWKAEESKGAKFVVASCIDLLAASHKVMHDDLANSLCAQVMSPEARCFFGFQAMIENIHAEALSKFQSAFTGDLKGVSEECSAPPSSCENTTIDKLLADKIEWASLWTASNTSFTDRLIAMGVIKRIFSSSLYALMIWMIVGRDFELPGLLKTLRLILDDIQTHVRFTLLLIQHLHAKPSKDGITKILSQAVDIEKKFAQELLSSLPLEDIDPDEIWVTIRTMHDYINFLSKTFMSSLGYDETSLMENPFPWMEHTEGKAEAWYIADAMKYAYTDGSLHTTNQLHDQSQIYQFSNENF